MKEVKSAKLSDLFMEFESKIIPVQKLRAINGGTGSTADTSSTRNGASQTDDCETDPNDTIVIKKPVVV
ncbi:hypothetical protein [Taibaiella chishuiensis]|uniref:Uncharacterized protein n=1 Tax=Taibaiella chishuiensis TaxID=1434707 RepID=A0A2P8DAE6_9BACT|nr:hypothetical protein [Taibaiella chishuiensis]PSK94192.1 hypothetical protein B0I18_101347 [Taibaiella chishuiensis]